MKTLVFLFTLIAASLAGQSQTVCSSAGAVSQSANISLSWTLGETLSGTAPSASVILTQGFQQPWMSVTAIRESETSQFLVYPNPVQQMLNIDGDLNGCSVSLFDPAGKLIMLERPDGQSYELDFGAMNAGIYMLVILTENGLRQSFSIVKP